ncbi:MAG: hypothetical protein HOL07_00865 [Rhodospirillaceae bacterium]|jgi:hypothetical protein|nr:hypothetical protein [Rhodospirillaceae bacterium]MBT6311352.1 hypothetical protein [Rhodospirillaceae bacterium]MBT7366313.1 hypothetical protein [Rhodospirillaceae bacterium]
MANLGEALDVISASEGIDRGRLKSLAESLRRNAPDLINRRGRGRGGAHLSSRDIANLMLAVSTLPPLGMFAEVPGAVSKFRELPAEVDSFVAPYFLEIGICDPSRNFGENLELLLAGATDGRFEEVIVRELVKAAPPRESSGNSKAARWTVAGRSREDWELILEAVGPDRNFGSILKDAWREIDEPQGPRFGVHIDHHLQTAELILGTGPGAEASDLSIHLSFAAETGNHGPRSRYTIRAETIHLLGKLLVKED